MILGINLLSLVERKEMVVRGSEKEMMRHKQDG